MNETGDGGGSPRLGCVSGRTGLVPPASRAGRGQRKLAQGVADELTQQIIDERWPAGRVMGSENELLERFNVSRAVLREAIRVLEHNEVATMRRGPGGGLAVTYPNSAAAVHATALNLDFLGAGPRDVFEARSSMELRCVELAAQRTDEAGIARLRAVVAAEQEPGHLCSLASHEIHQVLAEISGNPAFILFVDVLTQLTAASRTSDRHKPRPSEVHEAHQLIADAVIAGDAPLARHRMRAHLTAVGSVSPRAGRAANLARRWSGPAA
jgi:DNA-binding FadR family transcriptional regulator